MKRGIADEGDVPALYGLMLADERGLEVVRPAPQRPQRLSFGTWMALARAHPEVGSGAEHQALLGENRCGALPDERQG